MDLCENLAPSKVGELSASRFSRLQAVFDAATALSGDARQSYIVEACGGDEDLRNEVEALLSVHDTESPLLETGLLRSLQGFSEGDLVGPYRVVREIGRGGMGVVYLAEDTRLHRQVALKVLAPSLRTSGKQQIRFRREAEMAANISHPGVATIYALEESESIQYIVTEYVPGETLDVEFERGPLDPDAVIDIGLQLSAALSAAHGKGVTHRDLKPNNIIRASDGKLKLVDFGLALGYEPDEDTHTRLTDPGSLLGTPAYMSPEQLRGNSADFRSDLFSLGILLCEAATGQHPFAGSTVAVTMAALLESEPKGMEQLRVTSPGLAAVIDRCLRKDPEGRFTSAAELHEELERLHQQGPGAAPAMVYSPSERQVTLAWWVFHQFAVIVFCCFLTVALWQVNEWVPSVLARLTFIAGLAIASVITILRIHLVFTSRYNPTAILHESSRALPWLRRADWSFSLVLAAAAFEIAIFREVVAALLLGAAVAYWAVFVFVEPATRRSVFPGALHKG